MDLVTIYESITSTLGTSGTAVLFSYVSGIAANIHSNAIQRVWTKRGDDARQKEEELFGLIEAARPLREEFSRLAVNATRVAEKLGFDDETSALITLLDDGIFHAELAAWILSSNADDEREKGKIVADRVLQTLRGSQVDESEAADFTDTFLEIIQRDFFSRPEIVAWRNDVRQIHIQALVQLEAERTIHAVADGTQQVLDAIDKNLGPLLPTTADDVRKLRNIRDVQIDLVRRSSSIQIGNVDVKIDRPVVIDTIQAAQAGSLLLTGDPGAGKSICLIDVVIELRRLGFDVIYLDAQRLSSDSLGTLKGELGLSYTIDEILSDWPGRDKLFLCVDGLDAARSDAASRMLRDLIESAEKLDRWNVIASIRKFDMRYANDLKRLFPGVPASAEFVEQEFVALRHICVPVLSDEELACFGKQSEAIANLIEGANSELRELLRNPFNVWLAADVINTGDNDTSLASVRTQLQLLDLYWANRVVRGDNGGDARESVVFQACREMVSRRELKTPRNPVAGDPSASVPLHDLLSSNVLIEWTPPGAQIPTRQTLAFAHNILFDYATNLAMFAGDPAELIGLLLREPDLPLFLLPSMRYFFQKLWEESASHQRFWETSIAIAADQSLPSICKVIGPSVSVTFAKSIEDFDVLLSTLNDSQEPGRQAAEEVIQHVSGAILIDQDSIAKNALWIDLTERIALNLNDRLASSVNNLLWRFIGD